MITCPAGVGLGSTTTLNALSPTKMWSRTVEVIGSALPLASTLVVLSSSVQVAPPSIDRMKPTPCVRVSPLPVAAMMIDCRGSLFRGKTAMPPMFSENVGPKSVRGIQVGPCGFVVRKSVVFQTPPLKPPA